MNRRSVVGLESRLEKITTETQNEIVTLQATLTKEKEANMSLKKQCEEFKKLLNEYREKSACLEANLKEYKSKFEDIEEKYKMLKVENSKLLIENEKKIKQVEGMSKELHLLKDEDKIKELKQLLSKEMENSATLKSRVEVRFSLK